MAQYNEFVRELLGEAKKHPGQAGSDGNHELRTKVIKIRLSSSEFNNLLSQFEKSAYSTLAQFCRAKSLSKAITVQHKEDVKTSRKDELYLLSKISGNINQIAKRSNSGESLHKIIFDLTKELEEFRKLKKHAFEKNLRVR